MDNQEWIVKLFSQASLFGEDADDQDGLDELDEGLAQDSRKRANDLDGKTWLRYSVSIWSDIRKSPEEIALGHPAIFPVALAGRLIEALTNSEQRVIFDPFVGVGSTVVAAKNLGKHGIGIELNAEYVEKTLSRFQQIGFLDSTEGAFEIHCVNALDLSQYVAADSVDLVITSPPYWDILSMKRSADYKDIRDYGDEAGDLGKIGDYQTFLRQLKLVFDQVYQVMKAGAYCCVIVMDIRKKDKFYPFHSHVADLMQEIGFIYDDIIIWDRRHEYNNMRPLGYPYVFRVNKAHEFILIFQKPEERSKEYLTRSNLCSSRSTGSTF